MSKYSKKYGIQKIYINSIDREFLEQVDSFLERFEAVFHMDWDHTKGSIENAIDCDYIKEKGTFIKPLVEDESNNWWNRGGLLHHYRLLRKTLGQLGFCSPYDELEEIQFQSNKFN